MNERTALITGASSGLGRGLAERLASRGTHVVLAARRGDLLDEVRRGIEGRGGRATALPVDVADTTALVAAIRRADEDLGGLDLVVANAGIGGLHPGKEITWESCERMLHVNVLGAIATLTAVLPRMVERRRGHLVGVSSLAQYRGLPSSGLYSATKAALSTFLEGLRVDLHDAGVAVTDIRPGFVRTPIHDKGELKSMPFLMELGPAIDTITGAVDARKAVCAFPFPLAALSIAASLLPVGLYDIVARKAAPI